MGAILHSFGVPSCSQSISSAASCFALIVRRIRDCHRDSSAPSSSDTQPGAFKSRPANADAASVSVNRGSKDIIRFQAGNDSSIAVLGATGTSPMVTPCFARNGIISPSSKPHRSKSERDFIFVPFRRHSSLCRLLQAFPCRSCLVAAGQPLAIEVVAFMPLGPQLFGFSPK